MGNRGGGKGEKGKGNWRMWGFERRVSLSSLTFGIEMGNELVARAPMKRYKEIVQEEGRGETERNGWISKVLSIRVHSLEKGDSLNSRSSIRS